MPTKKRTLQHFCLENAVNSKNFEMGKLAIACGADPKIKFKPDNPWGERKTTTFPKMIQDNYHEETLKLWEPILAKKPGKKKISSELANFALTQADNKNDVDILLLALKHGADPYKKQKFGQYNREKQSFIERCCRLNSVVDELILDEILNQGFKITYSFMSVAICIYRDYSKIDEIAKSQKIRWNSLKDKDGNNLLHSYFEQLGDSKYSSKNGYRIQTFMPTEGLKFLLEKGVDPNHTNKKGETPIFSSDTRDAFVADPMSGERIKLMIQHNTNFTFENPNKKTAIEHLVLGSLQAPQIMKVIKLLPKNQINYSLLKSISKRRYKATMILKQVMKDKPFKNLPIFEMLYPRHEESMTEKNFKQLIFEWNPERFDPLFQTESLTEFTHSFTGLKSSQTTNTILQQFGDYRSKKAFSFAVLNSSLVFKRIFMEENPEKNLKQNPQFLIDLIKNEQCVNIINFFVLRTSLEQVANFFRIFSHQQVKLLLENTIVHSNLYKDSNLKCAYDDKRPVNFENYCSRLQTLTDCIKMFWKHPEDFKQYIQEQKFNDINNLEKLHDFMSGEIEKIENKPFDLQQEKHHPQLNKVLNKQIGTLEDFHIIIPKTNHDLIAWGSKLGNCIGGGSYADEARDGETLLLGVAQKGVISYAIEIQNKKIIQNEGKSRSNMPEVLRKSFVKELKSAKIIA